MGVTSLLGGDLEAALDYFQQSVILKKACFEENDTTVAVSIHDIECYNNANNCSYNNSPINLFPHCSQDSLVEIGIILYNNGDLKGALNFFHEALDIYVRANDATCTDSIGRTYNNIGCVYYKMNELDTSLQYMQKSLVAQRNALGLNSKAESALLNYALTQANTGYLKYKSDQLDATALLEDSLLVSVSML